MHLNERRPGQRLEVLQSHLAQPNLNFTLPKVPLCGLHQRRRCLLDPLHLRPPLHRQASLSSGAGPRTVLKQWKCQSLGHGSRVQRYNLILLRDSDLDLSSRGGIRAGDGNDLCVDLLLHPHWAFHLLPWVLTLPNPSLDRL